MFAKEKKSIDINQFTMLIVLHAKLKSIKKFLNWHWYKNNIN